VADRDEPVDCFEPAQAQLAEFYSSDPKVKNLSRVMRLPGFLHRKGEPLLVTFAGGSSRRYTLDEVLVAHRIGRRRSTANAADRPRLSPAAILGGVLLGQRDDAIYRYACSLRARRLDRAEAEMLILKASRSCSPPFPEREAMAKLEGAWKHLGETFHC
jgi:hypothetical protein